MYYQSAFITLNDVVKQYALSTSAATGISATTQAVIDALDTVQRTQLKQLLFDVSDEIMAQWYRTFVPYIEAVTVTPSMNAWCEWRKEGGFLKYNFQRLEFADLLSLSAVSIDGTSISSGSGGYRLEGQAPYEYIVFDTTVASPTGSSFDSNVIFTGTWGYHKNPSAMWSSIGTLQANLTDSATSFVATAGTVASFETYQYLQIESEILFVTDVVSAAPYTITVERGARGSTAAAHTSTTAIKAYRQMPAVIKAVRRRVVNLMQKMPELANLVQIGEAAFEISPESIDLKIDKRLIWGSP